MAVTTQIERIERSSGPAGLGIVVAGDRSRDFLRARRHSLMVRLLRVGLPLASLGLVAGYMAILLKTVGFGAGIAGLPIPRITAENLVMDNPHYEGFNKDGGRYAVSADTAQQDFASPGIIKLKGIKGVLHQPDASRTDITSTSGVFDNKANRLDLAERIKIVSSTGLTADLTQATVMVKASTMTSSQPVRVTMPSGTVDARTMSLENKTRKVNFVGDVRTHIVGQPAAAKDKAPANASSAPGLATSGGPMDVTSERLDIDDLAATALFSGQVRAVQGDSTIESQHMLVSYERAPEGGAGGKPHAGGGPQQAASGPQQAASAAQQASGAAQQASSAPPQAMGGAGDAAASVPAAATDAAKPVAAASPAGAATGKAKRITIDTPLTLTRANGERVTALRADVDVPRQVSVLEGQVVVTAPPDRRVTSDRAEVDQQHDTILLTGAVHITQGRNELHGRRVLVDRAAKRTRLTAPSEAGGPVGHVKAKLYQAKDASQAARKAAKSAPQPDGLGFAGFKSDPNAPINVDSEILDIDDNTHKAIFRSAVHATQGELSITCEELTAHYTGSAGISADTTVAADGKGASQLNKLEARRKVVVTSAKGQKATGDWADFDPKTNTAVLGGNVVLTENGNVVTGTRLHIDMNTGLSNIETAPGETAGLASAVAKKPPKTATGADAPVPQFKAGRPSAVFYPRQAKDAAAKALGSIGSGWQSTTTPSSRATGN